MANPGKVHQKYLKQVLRYLNGLLKGDLKYKKNPQEEDTSEGLVDASYVGNVDTRKSLSGFMFTLFGIVMC